jgi:hypothetical protein
LLAWWSAFFPFLKWKLPILPFWARTYVRIHWKIFLDARGSVGGPMITPMFWNFTKTHKLSG